MVDPCPDTPPLRHSATPPPPSPRLTPPLPFRLLSESIQIMELSRQVRDLSRFLKVAYPIYANDPNWVAPLLSDLKTVFYDTNPLFEHAEMRLWVATRGGRDVGRIAG